jgi:spermidine synthase
MRPWEVIERAAAPDGTELVLARRGEEWEVGAGGKTLMNTRMHASEESLASVTLKIVPDARRVLVGGLGLGFTLRATLDLLPHDASVVLAELSPAIVAWNQRYVGHFAGDPLRDPRVELCVGDVRRRLLAGRGEFDAVLLDVDNGPTAMVQEDNAKLYGDSGIRECLASLRTGGLLAVWSASPDDRYLARLSNAAGYAEAKIVRAHRGRGVQHVIFLAMKLPPERRREDDRGRPDEGRRSRYNRNR